VCGLYERSALAAGAVESAVRGLLCCGSGSGLQGELLERQLTYWQEQLSGMPAALELPTDRPRPPVAELPWSECEFTIPAAQTQALRALARREGVTQYMVLLAALQLVLGRWSNQQDVAVASTDRWPHAPADSKG